MKKNYDLILPENSEFKDYFLNDENKSLSFFPKFNNINIIIGANNSGKSRFIRKLMSIDNFIGVEDLCFLQSELKDYNRRVSDLNILIDDKYEIHFQRSKTTIYVGGTNTDEQKAKKLFNNRLKELEFSDLENVVKLINQNKVYLNNLKVFQIESYYLFDYSLITKDTIKLFKDFKKYFIPTLRTAHSLFNYDLKKYSKIESDIYLATLNNNYLLNKINVDVFTGLHLYREILNSRNSEKTIRKQFEKFEIFLRDNFFNGKEIDIVAKFDKNDNEQGINESELILIHVAGDGDRKLYDLGDGIQALIILLYKIFMAEPESFIFIDEPEINLHPGMQRLFLEQITSNKDLTDKNLKYIITTHSNHFLDLTIEKDNVSIYSFSPRNDELNDKQFTIKNVNRGNNSLLKELGVNNSSVFMANCSIWVEGISDRNYIKAFLKSYTDYLLKNDKKEYVSIKEDIDFAFFEYAGSNIDHYIFDDKVDKEDVEIVLKDIKALSISNRIFLLADSDASKQSSKKGIRLKELEDAETDNFIPKVVWNIREIENLLTNEMWKEILIDLCNKTLVKSHEAEILVKIDEALSDIDYSKFSKIYIGEFLEEIRKKMGKISSTYILNQSAYDVKSDGSFGTIINKRELSELVFNKNFSWEILSKNKEIEKLTIEIYNFIAQK